jgi:hypothetical protein
MSNDVSRIFGAAKKAGLLVADSVAEDGSELFYRESPIELPDGQHVPAR